MSEIDIRNESIAPIDKIVFSDRGLNYIVATHLKKADEYFVIMDEESRDSVIVESREQTENLIKALQKAIELKWVD